MTIRGKAFSPFIAAVVLASASTLAVAADVSKDAAAPLAGAASSSSGAVAATATAPSGPLRVCADPDNLPFSRSEGPERGLYVELAELVGAKLGMPVQYTWWYTHMQRRALRNTILQGDCDAVFALPANADYRTRGVQKSRPFLDVSYALVAAPGFVATSLEALKGKRIALQYLSTPHIVFSTFTGYTTSTYRTPDEVFAALAKGEVDVGILWGPIAGYENKALHKGRWQITPIAGHDFSGQVVVGVRAGQEPLKARIDQALTDLQPQIRALAEKYAVPTTKPIDLEAKPTSAHGKSVNFAVAVPSAGWMAVADEVKPAPKLASRSASTAASKPAAKPAAKTAAAKPAAAASEPATPEVPADPQVVAGRVRFNDQCSHCHGANGFSPVIERDVRRLKMRYDAKWQETALNTIRNGRPDAGMPTWKGVIGEPEIQQLMSFLVTIQK